MIKRLIASIIPHPMWAYVQAVCCRVKVVSPALLIVVLAIALVSGRAILGRSSLNPHLQEISDAFGSAALLYGRPQSDHAGKRITFVQQGQRAMTVCLAETASRSKQVIYEEYDPWANILRVWPWSPDDRYFLYSKSQKLAICKAGTDKTFEVDTGGNTVREVSWLSPDEFVYVDSTDTIRAFGRQADERWKELFELEPAYQTGHISSLSVIDSNTIAWLQDGKIWRKSLATPATNATVESPLAHTPGRLAPPGDSLVLWLDASRLLERDGDPVDRLADLSRSHNDAVARIAAPAFNGASSPAALNGKGTLHFASATGVTNSSGLKTEAALPVAGAVPRTVFAVIRRQEGKQMLVNIGRQGNNGMFFGICDQSDYLYLPAVWGAGDNRFRKLEIGWHVLETVYDGNVLSGYVNGEVCGTHRTQLNTESQEVEIGLRSPNGDPKSAMASDGDFAELLVYDRELSDSERQEVRDYLNAKWFGGTTRNANGAVVWADPKMEGLSEFSYSKELKEALLNRSENGVGYVYRLPLPDANSADPVRVFAATTIQNLCWLNEKQCLFTDKTSETRSCLVMANVENGKQTRLFPAGDFNQFGVSGDGKHLFAIGSVSNELTEGLWRYDVASGASNCLVPGTEHPSTLVRRIDELHGSLVVTNGRAWGGRLDYYVYLPANFNPREHKKYPLVIGNTLFVNGDPLYQERPHGPLWVQALANCGAVVAVVDRRIWTVGIEQWPQNVMALYRGLRQNDYVDLDRVFLFASSAETQYLGQLLATNSAPWKGVIMLNPGPLPDLEKLPYDQRIPEFLISLGQLEDRDLQMKLYQQVALHHGIKLNYLSHAGATHWLQGQSAVRERTDALIHFVFDNP